MGSPNCLSCHKNALVTQKGVNDSLTEKNSTGKTLFYHAISDDEDIRSKTGTIQQSLLLLMNLSVHASEIVKGNPKAATCIDCHTAHGVIPGSDEKSTVNKFNIPNTCGTLPQANCERISMKAFMEYLLPKEITESPVCTDCHGEHNILQA
ncbi:MAG: hypothetical protein MZV64_41105 [Ignavibacteriales bacterium]|nr:hypothetical protein [Ignavibacteriales bacterium]